MNIPAIIAIPVRIIFVVGVLIFLAVGTVIAAGRWFVDAVLER